jgi:hypothetical protein
VSRIGAWMSGLWDSPLVSEMQEVNHAAS